MTQERDAHIHTPLYDTRWKDHQALAAEALFNATRVSQRIFDVAGADYPQPQDEVILGALRTELQHRWSVMVRPMVLGALSQAGLKTTPVIIPCPGFGRIGRERQGGDICLSWASADTGNAHGELWYHYLTFHYGMGEENGVFYTDLAMRHAFRMHRLIEQGVRL